tara:strand:- start:1107 stop:2273 length:1167 start_codon:yes stop_codon:yes gene_type:complete
MEQFIPYSRQNITKEDIEAVNKVLKSDLITSGPVVPLFEKSVSEKLQAQYSIATNSATSALHIACLSIGLKEGEALWTSPITFVASSNCGLYCGAKIDFIDINISTGLIDINNLEKKLKVAEKEGNLPKVIIPVHLAGASCDMKKIKSLSEKYGFYIIEDASHAFGGKYNDFYVGGCQYSDITVFSFHPVKIITAGEGGLATTNNFELAQKMRDLRSHGIVKETSRLNTLNPFPWQYEQQSLGFNYRMSDINAALVLNQFKRVDEIVDLRNQKLRNYILLIKDMPVKFLEIAENVKSSVHLGVISFEDINEKKHSEIFSSLRQRNIGVQLHYSPVHLQPFYRNMGFYKGQFPASERYSSSSLSLPLFPELTFSMQENIVNCLKYLINN